MKPQAGDVWRKGDEWRRVVDTIDGVSFDRFGGYGDETLTVWYVWSAGAVLVHRAGSVPAGETVTQLIEQFHTVAITRVNGGWGVNATLKQHQIGKPDFVLGFGATIQAALESASVPVVAAAVEGVNAP